MLVKIGSILYDSNAEPIMLILDDQDKSNISSMDPKCQKYCSYPAEMDPDEARKFMRIDNTLELDVGSGEGC